MTPGSGVGIGLVGTGFIAETRARAYRAVTGYDARLVAVAGRSPEHTKDYARRHGIPNNYTDYRRLLERADVQVVDLCVPNNLHREMAEAAAAAGKHVICSKPLTAVESRGAETAGRRGMLQAALESADAMVAAADRAGVFLMYAENWVYAPSIVKADRLAAAAGGVILEMRGGECHSGSHSPYSKEWRTAGGGALLRLGVHPIGAMLHLKRQEGMRRWGRPVRPEAVTAETTDLTRTAGFEQEVPHWIGTGWVDVENWGTAIISFDDGSRGVAWASDGLLGGMESDLQVLLSNAHVKCHLAQSRLVEAYAPEGSIFGSEYLTEKLETKAGWSTPAPDEDWAQGHLGMIQDFVASAASGNPPRADGALGRDAIEVVYAAYVSAASGSRVTLRNTT